MKRVLHVLAQRPLLTGSGVTLDALVREADGAGWDQHVVVGVPHGERPAVGGLPAERITTVEFGEGELTFAVPGMSDVMPYESSRFRDLDDEQWNSYRCAWLASLERCVARVRPDVIHAHHVWVVSSLMKDIAADVPVVTHCHATGLRQLELCPHRAGDVRRDVARNERFVVLGAGDADALCAKLGIDPARVTVVGAGYRQEVFHTKPSGPRGATLAYAGKLSEAKGVGELCEAFARLRTARPDAHLHVAGGGAGPEADALRARLAALGPSVTLHGHVAPPDLAEIFSRSAVCVLPSFYEGLPLVLVEAAASGCRLVATALPGIVQTIAPHLRGVLHLVEMPQLAGLDRPDPAAAPKFVENLARALQVVLAMPPPALAADALAPFTWRAVFERVEGVWRELLE